MSTNTKKFSEYTRSSKFTLVKIRSIRDGQMSEGCTALALSKNKLLSSAHCTTEMAFEKEAYIHYLDTDQKDHHKIYRYKNPDDYDFKFASKPVPKLIGTDLTVITLVKDLSREIVPVKMDDFLEYSDFRNSDTTYLVANGSNELLESGKDNRVLEVKVENLFTPPIENGKQFPTALILQTKIDNELVCKGDSGGIVFVEIDGQPKILGTVSVNAPDRHTARNIEVKNKFGETSCTNRFVIAIASNHKSIIGPLLEK